VGAGPREWARQGASVGRRGASPTPQRRHTPQKATIRGRALDVPVGSSRSSAGGSSSSAGGHSSVAGAAGGHSSVAPWRVTRVGAVPGQVCPGGFRPASVASDFRARRFCGWCIFGTPERALWYAAGGFHVVYCAASCMGPRGGGMFAHANPSLGILIFPPWPRSLGLIASPRVPSLGIRAPSL